MSISSDSWEEGFSYLKQFSEREGHCRVSATYKTNDGYRLGQWVRVQRRTKDQMDPDRRRRLGELPGWSWDVLSHQWEEGFSHLKQFSEREGHCRVSQRYKTDDGYRLGQWVQFQRETRDKMDPDRRRRLEELPDWSWDVLSDQWEEGFSYLKQFSEWEGHCRVSQNYKTEDGYRLGGWVGKQRDTKDEMDPDRRRRLEELPGWSWDVLSHQWEEGFSRLKQFSEREGHCRVSATYKTNPVMAWLFIERRPELRSRPASTSWVDGSACGFMSTIVSVVSKRTCHEILGGHDINWLFFRVPVFGHERAVMILSYDANLGRWNFRKGQPSLATMPASRRAFT